MIKDNVIEIQSQISNICNQLGRNSQEITLVGITKYVQAGQVREVIDAGVTHIGENRVMDAKSKFAELSDLKFTKHMVGHLQTNKVKLAVELFDLIHSVDSLKLACEIEKHAEKVDKKVNILLQVNTAFEEQKYGLGPDQVTGLIDEISRLKHIKVLGFMTMAPFVEEETIIRKCFADLRTIFDSAQKQYAGSEAIDIKYLSMGMTSDFPLALAEGANMLRIGRALYK